MKRIALFFMLLNVSEAYAGTFGDAPAHDDWVKGRWIKKQNSGINFMSHRNAASFYYFVDTYCKEHPLNNRSDAVGTLASELIDEKNKQSSRCASQPISTPAGCES